ncbi:MAG: hypothetical protein ISS55_03710 [Dehalococcoidales bacterium]|nr:hypothetical protein [Dehalococcoidales bacterium]
MQTLSLLRFYHLLRWLSNRQIREGLVFRVHHERYSGRPMVYAPPDKIIMATLDYVDGGYCPVK